MNQPSKSPEPTAAQSRHGSRAKAGEAMLDKSNSSRRKPKVAAIVLLMMVVWGLYLYQDHHPARWFLIVLSLALAAGFSGFLLYCLVKRKFYNGRSPMRGAWIYRDEDPFIYWMYMALYSVFDGAVIYQFFKLSHQFFKGQFGYRLEPQCNLKKALAGGLVMTMPLMAKPLLTVTQGPVATLVVICSTKFVPVAVGKNTAG
jgi:hypothetical protein